MVELLRSAGIILSVGGAALLYVRTEGWAAGLRLAAISLARHPDPERLVTEFSGSERNVAGYLLAEVWGRQPPEVREMLLRTSVLDRVCGPLADFLTGGSGAERMMTTDRAGVSGQPIGGVLVSTDPARLRASEEPFASVESFWWIGEGEAPRTCPN